MSIRPSVEGVNAAGAAWPAPVRSERRDFVRGSLFVALFVVTNASLLLLASLTIARFLLVFFVYGAGTGVMLFLLFHPRNNWLVPNRHSVAAAGHMSLALTFDDGPSPETTPRVLAVLRDKQVPATFFVVGKHVVRHPELARQVAGDGHTIGNHTDSHPALFCFLTPRRLAREIDRAQQAITRATGVRPLYFRSPVGLRHPFLALALRRAGLEFVSWRLRSYDTYAQAGSTLRARILNGVRPGDIVLLHDRPGPAFDAMVTELPGLIDALRSRGFQFVVP